MLRYILSRELSFFRASAHKRGMMSGTPSAGCAALLHYQPQTGGRCCSATPGGSITNPFQHPPSDFSKDPVTLGGKKTNIVFDLQLTGFTNNDKQISHEIRMLLLMKE